MNQQDAFEQEQANTEVVDEQINKMSKLKKYIIYIKSHTDAPDYEDETIAVSKEIAAEYFAIYLNKNPHGDVWTPNMLMPFIEEEE